MKASQPLREEHFSRRLWLRLPPPSLFLEEGSKGWPPSVPRGAQINSLGPASAVGSSGGRGPEQRGPASSSGSTGSLFPAPDLTAACCVEGESSTGPTDAHVGTTQPGVCVSPLRASPRGSVCGRGEGQRGSPPKNPWKRGSGCRAHGEKVAACSGQLFFMWAGSPRWTIKTFGGEQRKPQATFPPVQPADTSLLRARYCHGQLGQATRNITSHEKEQ